MVCGIGTFVWVFAVSVSNISQTNNTSFISDYELAINIGQRVPFTVN